MVATGATRVARHTTARCIVRPWARSENASFEAFVEAGKQAGYLKQPNVTYNGRKSKKAFGPVMEQTGLERPPLVRRPTPICGRAKDGMFETGPWPWRSG